MIRPATHRTRFLILAFVVIVYFNYVISPEFGNGGSSFKLNRPGSSPSGLGILSSGGKGREGKGEEGPRYGNPIQFDFKGSGRAAGDSRRAHEIKETMSRTFWKYRLGAWGSDEIMPISGDGKTTRNGWAATIVDTLTTTAMMGLEEEFKLELNFTLGIDFSKATDLVDPFETTIRYLGALVSTVELIDNGVVRRGLVSEQERNALVAKAVELADKLASGFDSPSGMIWPRINFDTNKGCREDGREVRLHNHPTIGPARAGTNWLENKILSKLTGNDIYGKNATRAWKKLVWNEYIEDWPGLVQSPFDIMTGKSIDKDRSLGGGHDSYYEYLIKAQILAPKDRYANVYGERWVKAVESTIKHLAQWSTPGRGRQRGKLFLAQWKNGLLTSEMGHLACFAGGNFILGGKYLGRRDFVQFGLDVVDGCHETYVSTITRIGPELFAWTPADKRIVPVLQPEHEGQREQKSNAGFWVTNARYLLRPETVESYFYAYRATGNQMYQEWAWDAYKAYMKTTIVEFGYASIKDVTLPEGGGLTDQAESFWGGMSIISLPLPDISSFQVPFPDLPFKIFFFFLHAV
ncbi:Glycoside Hydrolase Family 47 protein [Tuber magnatum]|uniref:alpha-1,2-Mannosidase n=1 Tax=Tuber magnatum TaxID=42249 RepID=A0A317SBY0_9PEZI|nr:Glycoside Hydrolase Family 47 protein [Tuber magnatum]